MQDRLNIVYVMTRKDEDLTQTSNDRKSAVSASGLSNPLRRSPRFQRRRIGRRRFLTNGERLTMGESEVVP
jgi:uncharacterized protein (DUF39 family)